MKKILWRVEADDEVFNVRARTVAKAEYLARMRMTKPRVRYRFNIRRLSPHTRSMP